PSLNKLTRHDESISAIVSFSAEDPDLGSFEIIKLFNERLGHAHAGIFHQKDARNAELFGRETVDFTDLLGCENFHERLRRGEVFESTSNNDLEHMLSFSTDATRAR